MKTQGRKRLGRGGPWVLPYLFQFGFRELMILSRKEEEESGSRSAFQWVGVGADSGRVMRGEVSGHVSSDSSYTRTGRTVELPKRAHARPMDPVHSGGSSPSGRLGYIGFWRICGSVCRGMISGDPQNSGRKPTVDRVQGTCAGDVTRGGGVGQVRLFGWRRWTNSSPVCRLAPVVSSICSTALLMPGWFRLQKCKKLELNM